MHRLKTIISTLDYALATKRRRHLIGGILLSVSLLFGGLAVTIITLKTEDESRELYIE